MKSRTIPFPLGLSALAMCAPSEKFLNMGGPLAIGLGVVFVSSLGRCDNLKDMNCIYTIKVVNEASGKVHIF